ERPNRAARLVHAGPPPSPCAARGPLTAECHQRHKGAAGARPEDRHRGGWPPWRDSLVPFAQPNARLRMPQWALPPRQSYRFQRKLLETFGDRGLFGVGWPVGEVADDGSLRRIAPASTSP